MTKALVRFICVAPDHSRPSEPTDQDVVTIHFGEWAFCRSDRTDAHVWDLSDGIDIAMVRARRGWGRQLEGEAIAGHPAERIV